MKVELTDEQEEEISKRSAELAIAIADQNTPIVVGALFHVFARTCIQIGYEQAMQHRHDVVDGSVATAHRSDHE